MFGFNPLAIFQTEKKNPFEQSNVAHWHVFKTVQTNVPRWKRFDALSFFAIKIQMKPLYIVLSFLCDNNINMCFLFT